MARYIVEAQGCESSWNWYKVYKEGYPNCNAYFFDLYEEAKSLANMLNSQQEALDHLHDEVRWRDAKEESPDSDEDVLVCMKGRPGFYVAFFERPHCVWYDTDGERIDCPEFWRPIKIKPPVYYEE